MALFLIRDFKDQQRIAMPHIQAAVSDDRMGPMFARTLPDPERADHFKFLGIGLDQSHMPAFTVAVQHPIGIYYCPTMADLPGFIKIFPAFPVDTLPAPVVMTTAVDITIQKYRSPHLGILISLPPYPLERAAVLR